jgi:hypothetical protein
MMRLILVVSLSLFAAGSVIAQEGAACAAKAVGKDGKALAGAAKASSMKKCCEASAVGKDGKKLAGAAKASFMRRVPDQVHIDSLPARLETEPKTTPKPPAGTAVHQYFGLISGLLIRSLMENIEQYQTGAVRF